MARLCPGTNATCGLRLTKLGVKCARSVQEVGGAVSLTLYTRPLACVDQQVKGHPAHVPWMLTPLPFPTGPS